MAIAASYKSPQGWMPSLDSNKNRFRSLQVLGACSTLGQLIGRNLATEFVAGSIVMQFMKRFNRIMNERFLSSHLRPFHCENHDCCVSLSPLRGRETLTSHFAFFFVSIFARNSNAFPLTVNVTVSCEPPTTLRHTSSLPGFTSPP